MNEEIIKAYLWQDIIRLGFSHPDDNTKSTWLRSYNQSLKSFWELDDYPVNPTKANGKLSCTINCQASIDIIFEYTIEESNKFAVRIMSSKNNLMWIHDYDNSFFNFPQDRLLNEINKRKEAINHISHSALQSVIKSLITHPTPHQHVESPLDNHDIRIGGGIINPYLYLFHLRFQFCPDQTRQEMERARLITLFENAICKNTVIPPNELMKLPV